MLAFDSFAGNGSIASSPSWTHTTLGNNRALVVGILGGFNSDNVTGVTYNSVSMTQIVKASPFGNGTRYCYLYYLTNPTLGANTVAVTMSSHDGSAMSVSYTGAQQSGQPDANTQNNNGGASTAALTTSLTTNFNNCMVVNFTWNFSQALSAGTNATNRGLELTSHIGMFDSLQATKGTNNLQVNAAGSDSMISLELDIIPMNSGLFTLAQ